MTYPSSIMIYLFLSIIFVFAQFKKWKHGCLHLHNKSQPYIHYHGRHH
eukprot:CAMPEP_0183710980 /NCGR_PEP_ID=MMETSP0737-20130205/6591_1 /TAXON_ID=385413 /ORGANISM="Thalassiosira miniscula, Strain CCMP1093" /LENGTH=47 /DNA_ID= /DNA_START= /DNA_END= /DNA_ORIENTATION=